jgi:hypothetical protein
MSPMIRCLTAALLVLACSGAAFGQAEQAYRFQTALEPWGDNVLVTCVLTQDQPFEKLFSNNLLVSDMVAQWKANLERTPVAARKADEIKDTLAALIQIFAADRTINWTAQDVLVRKWAELPGDQAVKKEIRAAFETLKADGLTCLSFLTRAETEAAPQALVTAMMSILANPRLSALTHMDLYGTTASGEYSDTDMDLLLYAMNDVPLLRTDPPNAIQEKAVSHCCNRTTRTCASSTGGCCTMCGTKCCLGATWCP